MTDDIDATIDKLHAAGATDDEITEIIREKFGSQQAAAPEQPAQPGTNSALTLAGAGAGVPLAGKAASAFAASPNVAKTGSTIARTGTTLGMLGHGIATGNMTEVLAAPAGGWSAGKGGWFLGKGAQSVAKPVGSLLGKMAPYAQTLSTLAGPQSVLDLAQMAEPTRQDIGFLGMGKSVDVPGAKPPVINALIAAIRKRLSGGQ